MPEVKGKDTREVGLQDREHNGRNCPVYLQLDLQF